MITQIRLILSSSYHVILETTKQGLKNSNSFFLRVETSQFVFNFASEQMATFAVIIFQHKRLIDSLVVRAFTSYGENLSSDSCFESNKAGLFLC